ncbi:MULTISPECIES: flavodoxin domain-containing protein [unclassified Pseudodesulfovibrio]|uniref:flavodoxin family protein n=1 Tax=unclassified Pseudodesulfovibrio TaxID=2661612 RepID=UPI001F50063D|nr:MULTISPECIES: flavodoxin domain-containing protein [unclassified Pseudodesulfovibrio]MCJ2163527.1 flavodoxin domain-containing protein [Pseudodesulfovibrio sp. S3-i]
MIQVLSIYASLNGQTEKASREIERACADNGCSVTSVNVRKHDDILSLLDADITFIGSGVYTWLPGKQMLKWIERQLGHARTEGLILPGSPRLPGKFACVYCTYGGPHTGEAEAVPCLKYMGQLFDHLGITVAAEWSIPGAFIPKGMQEMNVKGRLGNIEDRPNADDLKSVYQRTAGLIKALSSSMI